MQSALADSRTFFNHIGKFGLLSLYEQRLNRSVHKNQAELRQMQDERRNAGQMALASPQPIDPRTRTAPNGFVCANRFFARRGPRIGIVFSNTAAGPAADGTRDNLDIPAVSTYMLCPLV